MDEQTNDTVSRKGLLTRPRILFGLFALLLFGFVIYYFSEISQEFRALKKINEWWLSFAFILQLVTYLLNAFIYRLLLRLYDSSHAYSLKELYKVSVISLFFNQTIPSAGISGNTFLFNFFKRKKMSPPLILSLVLVELLTFYAGIELFILFFFILSVVYHWSYVFQIVLGGGLLAYLGFAVGIVAIGKKKTFDFLQNKLGKKKIFRGFLKKVRLEFESKNLNEASIDLFSVIKKRQPTLLKPLFLQLLLLLVDTFTIVALFAGLGMHPPILFIALSLISTKIISVLPFSPGSLILYESSLTFFFVKTLIPIAPSLIVTLIYRLLSFWLPIPAGLLLYRQWLNRQV